MTGPTQETNALHKLAKLVVKAKINRLVAGDDLDRMLAVVEQVIDRKQRQGNAAGTDVPPKKQKKRKPSRNSLQ